MKNKQDSREIQSEEYINTKRRRKKYLERRREEKKNALFVVQLHIGSFKQEASSK